MYIQSFSGCLKTDLCNVLVLFTFKVDYLKLYLHIETFYIIKTQQIEESGLDASTVLIMRNKMTYIV